MPEVAGPPAGQCLLCGCGVERYREVKVAAGWTAAVSQLTRLLLLLVGIAVQYIYSVRLLKESYHRY